MDAAASLLLFSCVAFFLIGLVFGWLLWGK
jgi:hypothetical protein